MALGLDIVDNTAEKDKPVSTVQQEALDGVEARLNAKIESHISDANSKMTEINSQISDTNTHVSEIEKKITLSYSSVKEV